MKTLTLASVLVLVPMLVLTQTVDELVQKNIEAKGGLDTYGKITTLRLEAGPDSGIAAHQSILIKRPDKVQVHRRIGSREMLAVVNGAQGWMKERGKDVRPLTEKEHAQLLRLTHIAGILPHYKELGYTATLKGEAEIDGRKTYLIHLAGPIDELDIYLEQENWLERRIVHTFGDEKLSTTVCDWRTVRGVKIPFWFKDAQNSSLAYPTADRVRLNENVADAEFAMPK